MAMLSCEQLDRHMECWRLYYDEKLSTRQIAQRMNICQASVVEWIHALGGQLRSREEGMRLAQAEGRHGRRHYTVTPERQQLRDRALALYYDELLSPYAIGLTISIDPETVRQWILASGRPVRNRSEARKIASKFRDITPRCGNCKILLAEAPDGHDGLCGWCVDEQAGRYHHEPLPNRDGSIAPLIDAVAEAKRELYGMQKLVREAEVA